ncbi:unnamed protein product [Protopolystoma xenopodis]|uniref:Uncharacterized protein n=1 Tax=Protopolystoma xenopodis TaxID=117903 RepID=A0A3S4ZT75_9PLAT|nr:unnamed protein product [Protopolystoma xenopodis]
MFFPLNITLGGNIPQFCHINLTPQQLILTAPTPGSCPRAMSPLHSFSSSVRQPDSVVTQSSSFSSFSSPAPIPSSLAQSGHATFTAMEPLSDGGAVGDVGRRIHLPIYAPRQSICLVEVVS